MRPLDRLFLLWRMAKVGPYIPQGARVLDVGCGDGDFLRRLGPRIGEGVGIDSYLTSPVEGGSYRLLPGAFPDGLPEGIGAFDVITMMAVLEHIPPAEQSRLARVCAALLAPRGRLILTVPSPAVDGILHFLQRRLPFLYEGRSLEEHYGFAADQTPSIFSALTLVAAKKFEFGLNNLFVFEKPA